MGMQTRDMVNYQNQDSIERIDLLHNRSWVDRAVLGLKALVAINFGGSRSWWAFGSESTTSRDGTVNYKTLVGDGRNNAIVVACCDLAGITFAQSPIQVMQRKDDSAQIVPDHKLTKLLNKPNPYYSGKLLWMATIVDWMFGNAYWLKVRSEADKVVQLYWVPSTIIKPMWPNDDRKVFISHYEYSPNGKPEKIEPRNVVHFRNGMNPNNIRLGLSKLGALLREIATDDEASEFAFTILRTLGVAGMIISPLNEKIKLSEPDAAKVKQAIINRTTGDKRGDVLVLGGAVKVDHMASSLDKIDTGKIRQVPEARITAIFGTPAILLGLGIGLENGTYNNVDGLRKIYYENKIMPMQQGIAADLHTQLMPDFEDVPENFLLEFNNDDVRVLKEDETALVDRLVKELESGALTRNEFRELRNRKPLPGPDVLMISSRLIPVDVTKILEPKPQPEVQPNGTVLADATNDGNSVSGDGSNSSNNGGKSREGRIEHKDIGDSVTRVRARMHVACKADIAAYLWTQQQYVLAQIDSSSKSKARINWPRLQEDVDTLKSVLEPWYKRTLTAIHDVVQDVLDTRYELSGTDERTYLKSASLNIKGINETTRTAVQAAIALSVSLDEDEEELRARIVELDAFSDGRATLIAQTELAIATNLAVIESFKASEVVVGILITDGDKDKVCADLNGKRVPIAESRSIPPLGHPHCIRRFYNIMSAAELNDSEAA